MRSVMSTRFIDGDGTEWAVRHMGEADLLRFHYRRNRLANNTACYCPSCAGPSHIVQRQGLLYVAHDPGYGLGACEYADFVQSCREGMSDEHREVAANIALSIRTLDHWNAIAEKVLEYEAGTVRPDVYAWHNLPKNDNHNPAIHEVQISPQGLHETVLRTDQRRQAEQSAKTIWWTPHQATVSGGLFGVILDDDCTRVSARAYSALEPERIAMYPTVKEAAKRLTSDRDRWVLTDWRDDDTDELYTILRPQSLGSTIVRPARRRLGTMPGTAGELIETGCERPAAAPPQALSLSYPATERPAPNRPIYESPPRPRNTHTGPKAEQPERMACPLCGADIPAFTLDVHTVLAHPGARS